MPAPLLGPLVASLTGSLARLIPAMAKGAEASAVTSQVAMRAFARNPQMMVQGFQTIRGMGIQGAYTAAAPNVSGRDMRTAEQQQADSARVAAANPQSPFRQQNWFQGVAQGLMDRVVVTPTEIGKTAGFLGKSAVAPHEQAGAIGGVVVKEGLGLAAAFAKISQPLTPFAERLRDISNELIEAKRNLAEYNGTFAQAFAKLDVARERGNIETARLTSGSTSFLIDQQIALEKALRPILATVENVKNAGLAVIIQALLSMLEHTKHISEAIDKYAESSPFLSTFKGLLDDLKKANEGTDKNVNDTLIRFIERVGKNAQNGGDSLRPPLPWGQQFGGNR